MGADIEPAGGADFYEHGPYTINGISYAEALFFYQLECYPPGKSMTTTFPLSRKYKRFRTAAGWSDSAHNTSFATFTVKGDGRTLAEGTVGIGQQVDVDVDVSNVLQLQLVMTLAQNHTKVCKGTSGAGFGDPTVTR